MTADDGIGKQNIRDRLFGTFTFHVHNCSGDGAFSGSGATVSVYMGEALVPIRTYYVPTSYGWVWCVFIYDSLTGKITDINKVIKP